MTTFPALIPSTRTYSVGEYPNTAHPLLSGSEIRVRHSNTVLGVRLRLTFIAVSSSDVVAVRNHYNSRRGGFLPFAIPDDILSGVDTPADFTPVGHKWKYASRPRIADVPIAGSTPTNRHDLIVELETVPPENTIVAGARITVRAALRAGSAERGAFFEAYVMINAGAAAALDEVTAPGASITVDVNLSAGAASADVGGGIDVGAITYSQSSVYPGNSAATNAGMTNGITAETLEAATDYDGLTLQWIRMDLGDVYSVATVVVGCDFDNTLAGGWGSIWTSNLNMEHSVDGISWTAFGNTGSFATALKSFSVSFSARYIRISGFGYIAVTEFYATST